jgi:hypothetical protein
MPTKLTNVKIALLDFNLQKHKLQMGVSVVVTDTKQVAEIRQREMVYIHLYHSTPHRVTNSPYPYLAVRYRISPRRR